MDTLNIERASTQIVDRAQISASELFHGADSLNGMQSISEQQPNTAAAHLPEIDLVEFKDRATKLIDRVDYDHDGRANSSDILKLMTDPSVKGRDADVLTVMYRVSSHMVGHLTLDGVTVEAPDLSSRKVVENLKHDMPGDGYVAFANDASDRREGATTKALYSDSENPLNSIKIEAIHQGLTGDCYFESVLASTAKDRPDIIRDSINENRDGSFTVTFRGDIDNPVTVAAPTDAELGIYNGGSPKGVWAAVMEKAFSTYEVRATGRGDQGLTVQDRIAAGDPEKVIELITGREAGSWELPEFQKPGLATFSLDHKTRVSYEQAFQERIQGALDSKGVVNVDFQDTEAARALGLTDRHAYSVIAIEPGADGAILTVRNPWGTREDGSEPASKAETKISMRDLMKNGQSLQYQYDVD